MRIPLSWLCEYTDLPAGATPDDVMAALVKVGLEEEGSHSFGVTGPLVVGEVLEFVEEPQSNGKTIRWCQVRVAGQGQKAADGGDDVRGIVCGASNFVVGDKVVVCLPGAELPGNFKIAARSTYGHISDGMLASGRELGLSDDHDGIIRLALLGLDPKVGTDALELLHLDEVAAEVNVTPDRGYCLSIRGIAREYSHATGAVFNDPIGNVEPQSNEGFDLKIDDKFPIRDRNGVNRFVLRTVRNIDASRPTPPWMVARLKMAGMRSISLVVDITNYVMLEVGQPLHAYDLDKLEGGMVVRRALPKETLKTLDGQTRNLSHEDLVIADASGAIGIAGVMGGASTEVSLETKNVLIESANFDPISVARSARRHKLPSEAAKRFERGVDHSVAKFAAARVVQLLEVHARGESDPVGADYRGYEPNQPIWLPEGFATELVGVEYTKDEISDTLRAIGCVVSHVNGGFEVIAPTWRPDITHKTDLVEEIARITGYDRIPARLPVAPPGRGLTRAQKQKRAVVNALAAAGGIEVLNYPFLSAAQNSWFAANAGAELSRVKLANAMQEDFNEMRTTMLPGLIDAAKRNISRGLTDLNIFEAGSVFLPTADVQPLKSLPTADRRPIAAELAKLEASIPAQPPRLGAIFVGDQIAVGVGQQAQPATYASAIQAARVAAHAVGAQLSVRQTSAAGFHPGRAAQLYIATPTGETIVGIAGELHPELTAANDLPRRVAALELHLDALFAAAPAVVSAGPVYVYPAATQDLSLVVDATVPAAEVQATIVEGAGELLEAIALTDDYRGANVEAGKKSLTFALRFRASDRTLTQTEASESRDAAVTLANQRFGAEIRS